MKVAVSSSGSSLDVMLDPRFGRCLCFAVVDTETMEASFVPNPGVVMGQGAGIQAAQAIAAAGANAVIAGNVGPNAFMALSAAGIRLYSAALGSVRGAVEQFVAGSLPEITGATVGAHNGLGAGPGPQAVPVPQAVPGVGMGLGRGKGRGAGMGRGTGRGRGAGGGSGFRGGRGPAA